MFVKQLEELKNIANNLQNQGKSDEQVKQAVFLYLKNTKKKMIENGTI